MTLDRTFSRSTKTITTRWWMDELFVTCSNNLASISLSVCSFQCRVQKVLSDRPPPPSLSSRDAPPSNYTVHLQYGYGSEAVRVFLNCLLLWIHKWVIHPVIRRLGLPTLDKTICPRGMAATEKEDLVLSRTRSKIKHSLMSKQKTGTCATY